MSSQRRPSTCGSQSYSAGGTNTSVVVFQISKQCKHVTMIIMRDLAVGANESSSVSLLQLSPRALNFAREFYRQRRHVRGSKISETRDGLALGAHGQPRCSTAEPPSASRFATANVTTCVLPSPMGHSGLHLRPCCPSLPAPPPVTSASLPTVLPCGLRPGRSCG